MNTPTNAASPNQRDRFTELRLLLVDSNRRAAIEVQRLFFTFGFRHISIVTSGEAMLDFLCRQPCDMMMIAQASEPLDGVALTRLVRAPTEDRRLPRGIPIILLTDPISKEAMQTARAAGVNEFILKPFSAKTISGYILQVMDHPRPFIDFPTYYGPCRRRQEGPPPGQMDRRGKPVAATDEIVDWAQKTISQLETALTAIRINPGDEAARGALTAAARRIQAQAAEFNYAMGAQVAAMLVRYLDRGETVTPQNLVVLAKHIEVILVVFRQQIKDTGQQIAEHMLSALEQLVRKMG